VTDIQPRDRTALPTEAGAVDGSIFHVPEEVSGDERLSGIYNEIVQNLRREVEGIPMTTVQNLLIERIATLYVIIKRRDETDTWLPRQQKEYNAQFLAAGAEFNKLLQNNQEQQRLATVGKIQGALLAAINRLPDPEARRAMKEFIADEFVKAGL